MTGDLGPEPGTGTGRERRRTSRTLRRALTASTLTGLVLLAWCEPALGQDPTQGDTAAVADTAAPADTTEEGRRVPGEPTRPPPRFPSALKIADSTAVGLVRSWDRDQVLDAGAITLMDFLLDEAPELLQLRAGYYGGPHHLMDGLLGPGSVQIVVDERRMSPLRSAQPDLSRISLSRVERVRVVRRPGRTVVEITTLQHGGGEAYSRIGAGTGQPGADLIHGVFANGLGRVGALAGGVDYLNIAAGPMPTTRLDAWARAAWMPVDNDSGLELVWRAESMERTAVVASDFDRSELFLHGRANVTDGIQAEFWVGAESSTPGDGVGEEDEAAASETEASVTELQVTAAGSRGWTRGRLRLQADSLYPDMEARWRGAVRAVGPLHLAGGAVYGRWNRFDTWEVEAEVGVRHEIVGIGIDAGVGGSTGRRGLSYPGTGSADSVSFDAAEVRLGLDAGPYTLTGRGTYRRFERVPTFGGRFDRDLAPRGPATVRAVEGRVAGPLLPLDGVSDLLRVRGAWRHRFAKQGERTLYVPRELIQGELAYVDRFFEDNLEVHVEVTALRRSEMLSPTPGLAEPELLSAETSVRAGLLLRIHEFRLWWRGGNLRTLEQEDFGGLVQPINRNIFGISWEFHN